MINVLLSWYNFTENYIIGEMEKIIAPSDRVAIISFAHKTQDSDEYEAKYGKLGYHFTVPAEEFRKLGIPSENIGLVHYYKDSTDEMREKIQAASILLLTGGMPDKAMERLGEKGLIEEVSRGKKAVVGVSAGAMMQLDEYFATPDNDYPELMFFRGLGLVGGFHIEVHYEKSDEKWKALLTELRRSTGKPIYAIGNKGAVIVDDNRQIKVYGDVTVFG